MSLVEMDTNTIISIIQTIILFGGFVVGIRQITLLTKQISITAKQIASQANWQKKNVTFEYLKKYTNDLKECNISLQKKIGLLHQDGNNLEFEQLINILKDDNTRAEFYEQLSYFETLAIGIEENYFDENIAKKSQVNVVIATFKLIKPYIYYRRNETNRKIGGHFEKLAKNWNVNSS